MTEQIWKEFNVQLLGFIKSRVNNEEIARDILQEVFIKIHQKIHSIKDDSKITSWVYQITRNTIIDLYRKNKVKTTEFFLEEVLPERIELQNSDFSKFIIPFIKLLPKKDQEILNTISFGNVSQKEYAKRHNLSYSATKSRVQRARAKLKKSFTECCDIQHDNYGNIMSYSKKM